jgi:Protein of unknown function (DUF1488)
VGQARLDENQSHRSGLSQGKSMALERGIGGAIEQHSGDVLFPMNDGSRLIPCRVTSEALFHLTGGSYRTPTRAFDSVRLHVEIIASAKCDNGLVEEDDCITVRLADFRHGAH